MNSIKRMDNSVLFSAGRVFIKNTALPQRAVAVSNSGQGEKKKGAVISAGFAWQELERKFAVGAPESPEIESKIPECVNNETQITAKLMECRKADNPQDRAAYLHAVANLYSPMYFSYIQLEECETKIFQTIEKLRKEKAAPEIIGKAQSKLLEVGRKKVQQLETTRRAEAALKKYTEDAISAAKFNEARFLRLDTFSDFEYFMVNCISNEEFFPFISIWYTAHIMVGDANSVIKTPCEVFNSKQGECDDNAFFIDYFARKRGITDGQLIMQEYFKTKKIDEEKSTAAPGRVGHVSYFLRTKTHIIYIDTADFISWAHGGAAYDWEKFMYECRKSVEFAKVLLPSLADMGTYPEGKLFEGLGTEGYVRAAYVRR